MKKVRFGLIGFGAWGQHHARAIAECPAAELAATGNTVWETPRPVPNSWATPIVIENNGPNLLLDNAIRANGDGPLVINTPPADKADLIAIGNTWTARKPIDMQGRLTAVDNKFVTAAAIGDIQIAPAPFAARGERPVIEVPAGADAAASGGDAAPPRSCDSVRLWLRPWPV